MTSQNWNKDTFTISTDQALLDIPRIHHFLSTQAYWCLGIPRNLVEKSIAHSLCFGLYDQSTQTLGHTHSQVGYARVVSDYTTFAWICDVYIEDSHRNQGLSIWMMECLVSHPDLKNLRRLCLATKDAHGLYKKFGFEVTQTPGNWMEIKDNDLYKKMSARSK